MVLLAARVDADLLLRRACTGRPRRVHVQLDPFEGVPVPVVALAQMCAPVSLVAVAIVLVLEAGLLIGVVLPAGSLVLGLGVLGAMGVVPLLLAAFTAATGTVLGAALGHQVATRRPGGNSTAGDGLGGRLPTRITGVVDRLTRPWREAIRRGPVRAAATAQFVVGARTLGPRLAASAGVPLATMLRGTAPASLLWSGALVATGAVAGAALPLIEDFLTVAGIALALGVAARLLVRRRVRLRAVHLTGYPSGTSVAAEEFRHRRPQMAAGCLSADAGDPDIAAQGARRGLPFRPARAGWCDANA